MSCLVSQSEMRCTIFVSDGLADGYAALVVRVLQYHDLRQFYSEPAFCQFTFSGSAHLYPAALR